MSSVRRVDPRFTLGLHPANRTQLVRITHPGDQPTQSKPHQSWIFTAEWDTSLLASARALVEKGLVTGTKLDPDSQEAQCNMCIFACTTRNPGLKARVGPQA